MKKLIFRIVTVILAFVGGLVAMSYFQAFGNVDRTEVMAAPTLPIVSIMYNGREVNTMHGYVVDMDTASMRGDVIPLGEERKVPIHVERFGAEINRISFEVRDLDNGRLIENTEVSFSMEGGDLDAVLPLKDLLESGREYLLIIMLDTKDGRNISYYCRVSAIKSCKLEEALEFADIWHEAIFDKNNNVSISHYLETDMTLANDSLAQVSINNRYKQIIWDQMDMQLYSDADVYISEVDDSVTSLRYDYITAYEEEDADTEYYQVEEFFRIRVTSQRTYLLDYNRTTERIFNPDSDVWKDTYLELGIHHQKPECAKNEEENVTAFVQNGDLWVYDLARNNLSLVMGFRDGWDPRASFGEHETYILNVDEAGSTDFMVCGYMNRGIHEGTVGIAVYNYDAIANTVEEKVFLESSQPYDILKEKLGSLATLSPNGDKLYIYLDGSIYSVNLGTLEYTVLAEHIDEDCYVVSDDLSMLAWQTGSTAYDCTDIMLMNMVNGYKQGIPGNAGDSIRALGFMGTDFIWGSAANEDILSDILGNVQFPMYKVSIRSKDGQTVRDFEYGDKGKYVTDFAVQSNRIQLSCVAKAGDGYVETAPEPITYQIEEANEKIALKTVSDAVKKQEYRITFTGRNAEAKMKRLNPKQVVLEDSKNLEIVNENPDEKYYVYARGHVQTSSHAVSKAVWQANDGMGVVFDRGYHRVWARSGRKTTASISVMSESDNNEGMNSLQASLKEMLNFRRAYPDVVSLLEQGKAPVQILKENLDEPILNLSGCPLSTVLYYVSAGSPVLAITGEDSALLITGYDTLNIVVLDPITGKTSKMGNKDAASFFEAAGNLFVTYVSTETW